MIPLSLSEIARLVGGQLAEPDDAERLLTGRAADRVVTSVTMDSRTAPAGSLFVALAGERVDGHDFARQAVAAGAVAVLATRPVDVPAVLVPDAVAALGRLAAAVRRRLDKLRVVGITGSAGKTTTKDMAAQLLAPAGPVVAARSSYNNDLGLPLTVLQADADTRVLVLEMGARGVGHIARLCEIALPDIGVELQVGSAHLGEFGSREVIARAKGELVEALPETGVAVLNADDPLVMRMAARTHARVRTFGQASTADVRADDVRLDERARATFQLSVAGDRRAVTLGDYAGEHMVPNALAAITVALECGVPVEDVVEILPRLAPRSRWRMEIATAPAGYTVINDAYNANPESMRAALKALVALARAQGGRSWAVLGEMAELGTAADEEHDAVGRFAVRLDVSRLVAVGERAKRLHSGAALEGSWANESTWVATGDEALDLLRRELRPHDVVLVKASRVAGLERLAAALAEAGEGAA